ncbi:Cell division coordinator CpoB [Fundidesulfovibrio magnetotacticus]|uniref:Cell division coordinator CpoB n=1 Tax=Fundidesulfovibrio magnetotacticus TaxID=2730080 RepID=A0A6V8LY22_9BACT|nr:tetratricopeptide repeat protein [Fundidesulfovibrio magnetotacticus]GFK94716.1 Cell division coordinator CpoB [Fundidesulfovibrio magnetotacticus]
MMRLVRGLACAGLAVGMLGACAASHEQGTDPSQVAQANMQADVTSLKSRVQELSMRVEGVESTTGRKGQGLTLEDVNQRLARLEDVVTRMAATLGLDPGPRAPSAPSPAPSPAPAPAAPAYESRAPLHEPAPAAPGREDPYARYQPPTLQTPSLRLEQEAPGVYGVAPAGPYPAAAPTHAPDPSAPDEAIYAMGMESFSQRDFDRANTLFAELLKSYPNSRQAAPALFWQAESNYQQGDYGRAALLCQDLIQKYPSNTLVPSAMLKQALCFRKLGKIPAARIILQDVAKRYSGIPEGKSAQAQLKELK